jgi:PAS domain S-box-containing protein
MSEEQSLKRGLLAAMRYSTEPMVLCDPHQDDMPIVAINEAFESLSGYARPEILGRNCRFLQGPDTDPETVRRMKECLRQDQGCIQWLLNYRKNGRVFWNLLFISPIFAPDGRLMYFFANQHDLSAEHPLGLDSFTLGAAHMPALERSAFHDLLEEMGRGALGTGPHGVAEARSLEASLAGARQIAFLSTRLEAGPRV